PEHPASALPPERRTVPARSRAAPSPVTRPEGAARERALAWHSKESAASGSAASRSASSCSPSAYARLARTEEAQQRLHVRFVRAYLHLVHGKTAKEPPPCRLVGVHLLQECVPDRRITGVDVHKLAGLRILESSEAQVRQVAFGGIYHRYRDDVVPLHEKLEWTLDRSILEVGHDEHYRVVLEQPVEILECDTRVGSASLGAEAVDVAQDAQRVSYSLSRRTHVCPTVRVQLQSNPFVVAHRGHREHGGKLGHHLALETPLRSESLRTREIHRQHHGEFTLLD